MKSVIEYFNENLFNRNKSESYDSYQIINKFSKSHLFKNGKAVGLDDTTFDLDGDTIKIDVDLITLLSISDSPSLKGKNIVMAMGKRQREKELCLRGIYSSFNVNTKEDITPDKVSDRIEADEITFHNVKSIKDIELRSIKTELHSRIIENCTISVPENEGILYIYPLGKYNVKNVKYDGDILEIGFDDHKSMADILLDRKANINTSDLWIKLKKSEGWEYDIINKDTINNSEFIKVAGSTDTEAVSFNDVKKSLHISPNLIKNLNIDMPNIKIIKLGYNMFNIYLIKKGSNIGSTNAYIKQHGLRMSLKCPNMPGWCLYYKHL